MSDLEKYKKLFDETFVGFTVEWFPHFLDYDIKNVFVLKISANAIEYKKQVVNDGYTDFGCNLIFDKNGKLLKLSFFE